MSAAILIRISFSTLCYFDRVLRIFSSHVLHFWVYWGFGYCESVLVSVIVSYLATHPTNRYFHFLYSQQIGIKASAFITLSIVRTMPPLTKGCTPPISPINEVSKTFFEVLIFPYNSLRFPYPPNKLLKLTFDSFYEWKNHVNMIGQVVQISW